MIWLIAGIVLAVPGFGIPLFLLIYYVRMSGRIHDGQR